MEREVKLIAKEGNMAYPSVTISKWLHDSRLVSSSRTKTTLDKPKHYLSSLWRKEQCCFFLESSLNFIDQMGQRRKAMGVIFWLVALFICAVDWQLLGLIVLDVILLGLCLTLVSLCGILVVQLVVEWKQRRRY